MIDGGVFSGKKICISLVMHPGWRGSCGIVPECIPLLRTMVVIILDLPIPKGYVGTLYYRRLPILGLHTHPWPAATGLPRASGLALQIKRGF